MIDGNEYVDFVWHLRLERVVFLAMTELRS